MATRWAVAVLLLLTLVGCFVAPDYNGYGWHNERHEHRDYRSY
jgi:hypothetical protein